MRRLYDTASKMMTHAITAQTAKMDKKLRWFNYNCKKQNLMHKKPKQKWRYRLQGEAEEFQDPNSLINAVIEKMNKSINNYNEGSSDEKFETIFSRTEKPTSLESQYK